MNGHNQVSSTQMDVKPDISALQAEHHAQEMMNVAAAMQQRAQQQNQPGGYNPFGYGHGMSPMMQSPHSSMGSPPSLGSPGKLCRLTTLLAVCVDQQKHRDMARVGRCIISLR